MKDSFRMIILRFYTKFRNLILYGIIGCFASILDFCVFAVLTNFVGGHYILSNCISVLLGITASFLLNRTYNFKVKDKVRKRFAIFLLVGLCGLVLSNVILYVGIERLEIDKTIIKIASIILVVGFQFLLNKFVTFKTSKVS